jgi:hypothetical protein
MSGYGTRVNVCYGDAAAAESLGLRVVPCV